MNMLPPGVALLSACLKREGHDVKLFDTTYYDSVEIDGKIDSEDSDKSKGDRLMARPYEMPKNVISVKYSNVFEDFKKEVEDYNPDLQLEGIVINQFQNQANLPKELVSNLINKGYPVLKPYIPSSVIVRESHQVQKPLCYYKPSHKISEMFSQLAKKLAPQKKTVATRKPLKKNRKTPSSSDLSL